MKESMFKSQGAYEKMLANAYYIFSIRETIKIQIITTVIIM